MSQTVITIKNLEPHKISDATALSRVSSVIELGKISKPGGGHQYMWLTSFPDGLTVTCVLVDEKHIFSVFTGGES